MDRNDREIFVYADWLGGNPELIGRLYAEEHRGKETFSFAYEIGWLEKHQNARSLDPDLGLYSGRQYVPLDKPMFGIFSDSCPDRWGRTLMKRREALLARKEERKPRRLTDSDYLLGVYDETRMGALRFSLAEDGPFLSADQSLAAPPWITLRELEAASLGFENENGNEEKWLRQLLAPGSSLGGARPKASVQAPDGALWIAKFPSRHDDYNSGAWEMVVHELAALCGLNVPEAKLETFSKNGGTFLVKRFDRKGKHRIHFASAMTLLGKTDGMSGSYLELASFIRANGSNSERDLRELWQRIVFGMAVSNTDDHFRNHGFLLTENGWQLSPMYDVNPNIYGDAFSLAVDEEDASMDFGLAVAVAKYFEMNSSQAEQRIEEIKKTVSENWKSLAAHYGIGRKGIQDMEPAFDMRFK